VKSDQGPHGVATPGFNPKDTPEMYVNKIMQSRKRIEFTIKKYEEEQAAKLAGLEEKPVTEESMAESAA